MGILGQPNTNSQLYKMFYPAQLIIYIIHILHKEPNPRYDTLDKQKPQCSSKKQSHIRNLSSYVNKAENLPYYKHEFAIAQLGSAAEELEECLPETSKSMSNNFSFFLVSKNLKSITA